VFLQELAVSGLVGHGCRVGYELGYLLKTGFNSPEFVTHTWFLSNNANRIELCKPRTKADSQLPNMRLSSG
jgi:hypothetical protein